MPSNYVLLEKVTVGAAGAASVTFTSIPQTGYTDLVVKMSARSTSGADWNSVSFNGSSTVLMPLVFSDGVASAGLTVSNSTSILLSTSTICWLLVMLCSSMNLYF